MLERKQLILLSILLLSAAAVDADITLEHSVSVNAGGAMSLFASDGVVRTSIAGDKSWSETDIKPRSSMLAAFAKNNDNVSITRLDKDLIWQLNPKKEQYTEMTFEQLRAHLAQSQARMQQMQSGQGGGALPVSEGECEFTDSSMSVDSTGKKQRFANIRAEQHVVTMTQTCSVPEKNQTCTLTWTIDNWLAKKMPGDAEAQAFNSKMAEKMGVEDMMNKMGMSGALMAMFKDSWQEAFDHANELQGFPVKTVIQMEIGGENCTTASGQSIASDDLWASAVDAGLEASTDAVARRAGQKVAQETVGNTIGNAAVGGAAQEVIGGMLKGFGKRKNKRKQAEEEARAAEAAAAGTPGSVVLFSVSNELTSVSTDPVPADRFEIPAGWRQVQAQGF